MRSLAGRIAGLLTLLLTLLILVPVGSGLQPPCSFAQEQSTPRVNIEEQLELLAGYPDIKPGIELTKVAGWLWRRQSLIEEYR